MTGRAQDMATGRFVAYYRVSTARQGRSGLGLEAQRTAVRHFLDGGTWKLVGEFTEVESGKKDDRPQLAKALHMAKVTGARLVKLDRLSRHAAFLFNLRDAGVKWVAVDMPDANETVVGIMAVLAQDERERSRPVSRWRSPRRKKRGTRLGNPQGARPLQAWLKQGLGKLSRRAGKRERAQEHLTTATTMYRQMEMTYWLEQAEAEMRA
jgi:DNA invertase Pin-like site-specific DNA recombinase